MDERFPLPRRRLLVASSCVALALLSSSVSSPLDAAVQPVPPPPPGRDASLILQQAIDALASQQGGVLLLMAGEYVLARPISLRRNVTLDLNGAILKPQTSARLSHLVTISEDSASLIGGTLDGAGLVKPRAPFTQGLYPGIAVFVSGAPADVRLADCVFRNCPSGPILALPGEGFGPAGAGARNLAVSRCRFVDNQTWTGGETNALCHFHATTEGIQEHSEAKGYNWKGFYVGNGTNCRIVDCKTAGGQAGHASHYLSGGRDTQIDACTHAGPGFGFKAFRVNRPVVRRFTGSDCAGGGLIQDCSDFIVEDCLITDPAGLGLGIDGTEGTTPSSGAVGSIRAHRSVQGTTLDQSGIVVGAGDGGAIDHLAIRDCIIDGFFHGIRFQPGSEPARTEVIRNRISGHSQYGILALLASGIVSDNNVTLAGPGCEAAVFVADNGQGGGGASVAVSGNTIATESGDVIQVGVGFQMNYQSVEVTDNIAVGGRTFINVGADDREGSRLKNLTITNNQAKNLVSDAYRIGLSAHDVTAIRIGGNRFEDRKGGDLPGVVRNRGSARVISGILN